MKLFAVQFFLSLGIGFSFSQAADSGAPTNSPLTFSEARVFAPINGSNTTAGFAVVKNTTDKPVKLTMVAMSPFTAVEVHETFEKGGKMGMQKLEALVIPPKSSVELKPGSNHFMLFDASSSVKPGDQLKGQFMANGKALEISFKVVTR